MPDLFSIFSRRWKFILGFTLAATLLATIAAYLSPRKYLSTTTALPANSVMSDKARIFNSNIEALYSEYGSPDELDRIEGTALLDTIFIVTAKEQNLATHYELQSDQEGLFKAAMKLKKNTRINRSAYGELKIKVWDSDRDLAATLANSLLQKIQDLHQQLNQRNNALVLGRIREDYKKKLDEFINGNRPPATGQVTDTFQSINASGNQEINLVRTNALKEQLVQYENLINQYELALNTQMPVLLVVEKARPAIWPDKPKMIQTVLLAFFAGLVFSILLAMFLESRKSAA